VLIDAMYGGRDVQHVETLVKFEDGRSGVVSADLRIEQARTVGAAKASSGSAAVAQAA
jgi:long-chain acyl-CoA synthetase